MTEQTMRELSREFAEELEMVFCFNCEEWVLAEQEDDTCPICGEQDW